MLNFVYFEDQVNFCLLTDTLFIIVIIFFKLEKIIPHIIFLILTK